MRNELKWETDLHYDTSGNVRPWTYDQNRYMDMTEPLRQTMARNPYLKVLRRGRLLRHGDACSWAEEINFWHLGYDKTFTDRVSFGYYEAGHMIYIRPSAHKALKNDIAKFITANEAARPKITTQQ